MLTLKQFENRLRRQLGYAPKAMLQEYADVRKEWKVKRKELAREESALGRMEQRGCKGCEKKQQQKHIDRLRSKL